MKKQNKQKPTITSKVQSLFNLFRSNKLGLLLLFYKKITIFPKMFKYSFQDPSNITVRAEIPPAMTVVAPLSGLNALLKLVCHWPL